MMENINSYLILTACFFLVFIGAVIFLEKYSKPIYGTAEIPSNNFKEKAWIEINDGIVTNPYDLLLVPHEP